METASVEKKPKPDVKVEFLATWSADRGLFQRGDKAELQKAVASSLAREGIVKVEE